MTHRVRVKVCGCTTPDAIAAAVEAGADAVGFVFARSPRQVTLAQAAKLTTHVPPMVARVAVFKHPDTELIREVANTMMIDWMQSDAQDEATFRAAAIAVPLIPVYRDDGRTKDLAHALAAEVQEPRPSRTVLVEGPISGSGEAIDWSRLSMLAHEAGAGTLRLILAGGLNPDNVARAITTVKPYAVDVSSGVESSPGVKDPSRIRAFVAAVRSAERALS